MQQKMNTINKKIIIAIDGHSSCGKSTIAKDLAKIINYTYIDSGAMYRCITLFCLQHKLIDNEIVDEKKLKALLDNIRITFKYNEEKARHETFLNEELVEDEIRLLEVSNNVSFVAKIKFVRERLVSLQRELSVGGSVIMDGRDIGTVVFPNAELKIFMTADVDVRAERRYKELKANNSDVSYQEIFDNVQKRDYIDENRKESPLKKAEDAIILNNSKMSPQQQLDWIVNLVKKI